MPERTKAQVESELKAAQDAAKAALEQERSHMEQLSKSTATRKEKDETAAKLEKELLSLAGA